MNISDKGLALIKRLEGVRHDVYLDSAGKLTVGVGHLVLPADNLHFGDVISDDQVDAFLRADLATAERAVNAIIAPLNQNQFDALVSFTFNLGAGGLHQLIRYGMAHVPDRLLKFNHANGVVVNGLTKRREAERELYLTALNDEEANNERKSSS